MPPRRSGKLWRRILLAVVAPVLFFAALECVLRVAGVGYPTAFVISRTINGERVLTNNPDFGKRFFDARRSRKPPLFTVPARKAPDTFRLLILGGSAAMGDPYPSIGVARVAEAMLQAHYPGTRIEVVNAAMTAINSHVVRAIMRDCRRLEPDAVVIWMGNNEVVGPYGPASAFSPFLHGSPRWIRVSSWVRGTRIGQLAARLRSATDRDKIELETAWRGMQMFMNTSLAVGDPRLQNVYANFSRNLSAISVSAGQAGARVVLCTVPVNLGQCAPFGAVPPEAIAQYRLAQAAVREQAFEAARSLYEQARDLDGLRFRTDTEINRRIRDHASAQADIKLVDAVDLFRAASSNGIPGNDLFLDHVHPTFEGNYIMAHAICRALETSLLPGQAPGRADVLRGSYLTSEACRSALAHTAWDSYRIADLMYARMQNPPFTNQAGHESAMRRQSTLRRDLRSAAERIQLAATLEEYRAAIMRRPGDWMLRDHLATLLINSGRIVAAREQIRAALLPFPHASQLRSRLAATLALTGDIDEAFQELRISNPAIYSDQCAALEAVAGVLHDKGRLDTARELYDRALALDANRPSLHYHIGRMLLTAGAPADAETHFRKVLQAAPDHARTHAQLGVCLSQLGRRDEALHHTQRAVTLTPLDAARLGNLGGILAEVGRLEEAIVHLRKGAQLDPVSADIWNNLGYALSRTGQHREAVASYREAARLAPGHARIKINLADALNAAGQPDEAREIAEGVLKQAIESSNTKQIELVHARLQAYGGPRSE